MWENARKKKTPQKKKKPNKKKQKKKKKNKKKTSDHASHTNPVIGKGKTRSSKEGL